MSVINKDAFFGAVLKAIACTRNNAPDATDYAVGVLEPTSRIRDFEKELGDREITYAEAEQVLGWLDLTFDTKHVPAEEREYYCERVVELSGLAAARATALA